MTAESVARIRATVVHLGYPCHMKLGSHEKSPANCGGLMMTGARGGAAAAPNASYAFYSTFLILPAAGELPVRIHQRREAGFPFRPKCPKVN